MERWIGKVAIVTGASSGIGEAIAESLVRNGMNVVGIARRENRLKEIERRLCSSKGKFYPFKADVTIEEDIVNAYKWTIINLKAVHVVVNNAGIGEYKNALDLDTSYVKRLYDTNIVAVQISCREAVKSMKENNIKDGHIINISSFTGHLGSPFPGTVNYYVSKKALIAFTEGLRVELFNEGSDINVSAISPGTTDTEILKAYRHQIPHEIIKLGLKPSDVAEAVVFALQVPPHVVIHDIIMQSKTNVWKLLQTRKSN